jgi:hypothetical protein
MKNNLSTAGLWLGLASSAAQLILWLALGYQNQFYPAQVTQQTWLINAKMVELALAGMLVVWWRKPLLMLVVILVSFYPVGLYMLGVPSIFRWIGISSLFYLAASLVLLADRCRLLGVKTGKGENSYGRE